MYSNHSYILASAIDTVTVHRSLTTLDAWDDLLMITALHSGWEALSIYGACEITVSTPGSGFKF